MQTSESERSDDDSDAGNDPRQSSTVLKSSLHDESDYAAGSGPGVPVTPEISFEEQEGQSDDSDIPAQPQKRRRLPTKRMCPVPTNDSDSDGIVRDSLVGSPQSHKRGFKRPRLPWCIVKEWDLDEHDKEFAYEEIKTIMEQSLIDAGSKVFIRPNSNSIAGWRPKQVSYAFLCILLFTNLIFLWFCVAELCVPQIRHQAQYLCLPIC
jgi:hypothetical protein